MQVKQLRGEVKKLANPDKAKILSGFFKCGPGQYGAGDKFLGITVPQSRLLAKRYKALLFDDVKLLLSSPWHEERLIGVLIIVEQFKTTDSEGQKNIFTFYLDNYQGINNWDLVDLSADKIVGEWLYKQPDWQLLDKLSSSQNLWQRRIAILASYAFIKHGDSSVTLRLAARLLNDKHDLIQKAVGWMLREVGKRVSKQELLNFLDEYAGQMPRTMLRYAIERLTPVERQHYLLVKKNVFPDH